MEFRCPACDTSYRVPVRIDQQVRCARCNHVWRIAETDFVISDEAPADSEMPEDFSEDENRHTEEDAGRADVHERLSSLFAEPRSWRETPAQPDDAEQSAERREPSDDAWAERAWSRADPASGRQQSEEDAQTPADETAPWPAARPNVVASAQDAPQNISDELTEATGAAVRAAFSAQETTLSSADEVSPEQQIADDWFGRGAAQDENENRSEMHAEHSPASFERIMEGIEEVIAESGDAENRHLEALSEPQTSGEDNPLSALLREGHRGAPPDGASEGEREAGAHTEESNFQGAKVVQFTAPRAEQRRSEPNPSPSDPYAREPEDAGTAYYDPAHEAAQSESLAFSANEEAFAPAGDELDDWARDASSDRDGHASDTGQHSDERAYEHDEDHNHPRLDESDDDALLAEYDFGDNDGAHAVPPEIAQPQPRRRSGVVMVAAAWTVFLAVLAGAVWSTITFRERIVEVLPASANVYSAIGFPVTATPLALEDVSYALKGEPPDMLSLSGRVRHTGAELIEMPNLKITVRDDADRAILEDSRFLGKAALLPGETMEFTVNLEVSAQRLRTVELEF